MRAYEELVIKSSQYSAQERLESLVLPPGPRLGDVVVEAQALAKGFNGRLLVENLNFSLPPGGESGPHLLPVRGRSVSISTSPYPEEVREDPPSRPCPHSRQCPHPAAGRRSLTTARNGRTVRKGLPVPVSSLLSPVPSRFSYASPEFPGCTAIPGAGRFSVSGTLLPCLAYCVPIQASWVSSGATGRGRRPSSA